MGGIFFPPEEQRKVMLCDVEEVEMASDLESFPPCVSQVHPERVRTTYSMVSLQKDSEVRAEPVRQNL